MPVYGLVFTVDQSLGRTFGNFLKLERLRWARGNILSLNGELENAPDSGSIPISTRFLSSIRMSPEKVEKLGVTDLGNGPISQI